MVALGASWARDLAARDALGQEEARAELRKALAALAQSVNEAPRRMQAAIGPDLHLMSRAISRTLDRLESDAVPIIDPTLTYDLNLLADVAETAAAELRASGTGGDPERADRIDRLVDAASARLVEIDLVSDGWAERSRNAVVELQEDGGALVVRSTDRLIYDGVRYTSMALLLIGLLVVGVQLLRMSEGRVDPLALLRESPVLSVLAVAALTTFFAGCVLFSVRPGTLAALSAEVQVEPQEHPCERLAAQRDRLATVQQVDHAGLVEATKRRMLPAAQDCLGLPSAAATAEAVERLASRTTVTWTEPRLAQPARVAAAPAEPDATAADMAIISLALPDLESAELDSGETAGNGRAVPRDDRPAVDATGPAEPEAAPPPDAEQTAAPASVPEPVLAVAPPQPGPPKTAAESEPSGAAPETDPSRGGNVDAALQPEIYVTTSQVNYRAGPSLDARRLGTFIVGAELEVVGEDAGWAEVRLRDGREVYVATKFLELAP